MTIEVEYDTHGEKPFELLEMLEDIGVHAHANGMFTGSTKAEVALWDQDAIWIPGKRWWFIPVGDTTQEPVPLLADNKEDALEEALAMFCVSQGYVTDESPEDAGEEVEDDED